MEVLRAIVQISALSVLDAGGRGYSAAQGHAMVWWAGDKADMAEDSMN
jgi:hypothetical protein